ncbi:MAG: hypothetical protein ACLPZR_24525 [Solirubrobacteraceae bacterium]
MLALLSALGGAFLGVAADRLWQRAEEATNARKARRELDRLNALQDEERGLLRLHAGGVQIPSIASIASCAQGVPITETVRVEFERSFREARPDPPEWHAIRDRFVPRLQTQAQSESRPFTDDPAVDLVGAQASPPIDVRDPLVYRVGVAPTSYYRFAALSNSLDVNMRDIVPNMHEGTLRARWRRFDPRDLADLGDLPAPAKVGTTTVVASKPDNILLALIRGRVHQVGGAVGEGRAGAPRLLHFVAEGMTPGDRASDGSFSPEGTARRALASELGLGARADVHVELVPSGLFIDVQRWQPIFCYLAIVDAKFDEIVSLISTGAESNEHHGVVPLAWTAKDKAVQRLLGDQGGDRLASSHAKAALLYALFFRHGVIRTSRALRRVSGS